MLGVLGTGVLVAQAAKSTKPKAPKSKQMKVACAGTNGVLRYVSRASKCKKGEKALTLDVKNPIDACVKLHGTRNGVRGSLSQLRAARRLPAGTVRLSPPADCPAEVQPNEIGIKMPGPKKQWYCGRSSDGRLRWVSSRSKCVGRELPIWVPQGSPVRAPTETAPQSQAPGNKAPKGNDDSATTDKDAPVAINVLANDTDDDGDPLSVESVNTNGTVGAVTPNANGTITYDPAGKFDNLKPGQTGSDDFKYKVQDNKGGKSGETRVDVTINGKNLSPKAVNDSSSTDEETPKNLNVLANDTDAEGDSLTVGSIDDTGTVGDVSAGPGNTIDYDPDNQFEDLAVGETRLDTFKYRANDGNSNSLPATVTMTLTGVNDAPTLDTTNSTVPYAEDGPAVPVDDGVALDDVDGDQISGATVSITGNFSSADVDTLNFSNQNGITGTYNSGTGVLTLTGNASVANYQTALRSITFSNTSNTPSTLTRTVSFKAKDQHNADTNTDTRDVSVAANNDAPVNTLPVAGALDVAEDGNVTTSAFSISDADAGSDAMQTELKVLHGTLDVAAGGTLTGDNSATVKIEGTPTQINTSLGSVKYTPDGDFAGSDTLTMDTSDLAHNPAPAKTDSDNYAISVSAVNDAPVITRPATATTGEDAGKTFATGGADEISVADVDSGSGDVKADLSVTNGSVTLGDIAGLTTVTGNGTGTVSLTGTLTQVNEALAGLVYAPASNYNGSDSLSIDVDDQANTGSGGAQTDSESVAITVNAVNDAPENALASAGALDVAEDGDVTASNAFSISDVDAGSDAMETELNVLHGKLDVAAGGTVTNNGTATVTIAGSQAQINASLASVKYTPAADFAGSDTLTMDTSDLGHNPTTDPVQTDTDNFAISVSAVNDAPVVSVPGADSTNEDTAYVLSSGSSPSVADVDATSLKVTYSSTHGTMSLDPADLPGLTSFSTGDGTDDATMTFTGTKAAINAALNGSKFTPDADFSSPPNAVITLVADDEGATGTPGPLADAETIDITVVTVNDPPTVDTTDSDALFTEAQLAAIEIDPGVQLDDVDDTNLESATVKITAGHQASDVLNLPGTLPGGVTFNHTAGSDTLTITGTATIAEYEQMLGDVTFHTPSLSPGASRTVRFTVNDGTDDSPATNATRDIDITNTNDAPVIGNLSGTVTYTENDPATTLDADATVTDNDSPNLTSGTVTIAGGTFRADDDLTFTDQGPVTGSYDDTTGVLTISGTGTVAQYESFVRSVGYRTTSDTPETHDRTVEFQVDDGEPANHASNIATKTVTVSDTNDRPTVSVVDTTPVDYTENDSATLVNAPGAVTVADADSLAFTGATVSFSGAYLPEDVLDATASGGFTKNFNSGTGVLTISGTGSALQLEDVLESVTYRNTSDNPSGAQRTLEFVVNDGGATNNLSTAATRRVDVTAVNDAPAHTVPVAQSVDEDTDLIFSSGNGNAISVADPDAGGGDISTTLEVSHGTVTLSGIVGLTFTNGDGTNDPEMTFQGTVSEINTALAGLKYRGDLNYFSNPDPDSLVVTTSDLGLTPPPAEVDSDSVAITVNPVNDAPVADDETFNGGDSAVGNTTLSVNDPSDGRLATPDPTDTSPVTDRPHKEITGDILAGDADVDGPGPLEVTQGTFNTDDGGTVTLQEDGDFVYEPTTDPAKRCVDNSDFFDYTVEDSGSPEQTDTGRVTIAIAGCAWYVNNDDAQGNSGTSEKPFDTLAQAESVSGTGHSIFVYDGNNTSGGYNAGINLKSGQKLIGEAAALTVGSDTLHSVDANNKPTITDNNADVVDLDDGTEVKGFNIDPQGTGGGIAGSSGDTGGGTIDDVNIVDTNTAGTQASLDLDSTTGTFNISNLTVNNSAATGQTSGSVGVRLNSAGTVNFLPTGTISITTSGAKGLDASSTNMGTGSQFDSITVSGSGSGGVNMDSTVGTTDLGDGSGTDLNLTTTSGATAALRLNNAGTVNVLGVGTDAAHATGGPALDVSGMPTGTTLDFDEVDSSGSAGSGISVDNSAGTVTLRDTGGDGSDVQNATGADVSLTGNNAGDTVDFTYDGTVTDSTGQVVSVSGQNGGTKDFNGPVSSGTVAVSGDAGATTRFDGGLALSTGGSAAFSASTGGTVAVTDANGAGNVPDNTLTTTTGIALNVSNTTIHDDDLTFRSIDASDPASSGIALNTTNNANGRLVVTGNSAGVCGGNVSTGNSGGFTAPTVTNPNTADCTGGTIASAGTDGVSLNAVPGGVTLTRMRVTGAANDGINATSVGNGATLDHALVDSNGNAAADRGLDFTSVTGTSSISTSSVTGSADDNARWENNGTGTLGLTVANSRFADNSAATGADGLQLRGGTGNPTMTASIHDNAFIHNRDDGFQLVTATPSTAQMNVTFSANDIVQGVNNTANNAGLHNGPGSDSDVKFKMDNNDLTGSLGSAIILNPGPDSTNQASYDAIVTNNSIGTGAVDSGSVSGIGIWGRAAGNGVNRFEIRNNLIQNYQQQGMYLYGNEGVGQVTDYTVTGNNIGTQDGDALVLFLEAGAVSGDSTNVCFDVGGSGALANTIFNRPSGNDIGVATTTSSTMDLVNWPGGTASNPTLTNYFIGRNTPATLTAINANSFTPTNVANCALPATPALP